MEKVYYTSYRGNVIELEAACLLKNKGKEYIGWQYNHPKYGMYEIIEIYGKGINDNRNMDLGNYATILFYNTGTRMVYNVGALIRNPDAVIDPYAKTLCGVACVGIYKRTPLTLKIKTNVWVSMIQRCYSRDLPGYEGVTVCDKWLCFEYFLEDFYNIEGVELWLNNKIPRKYHLDKDLKQQGVPNNKKIYSLKTCKFVLNNENCADAGYRMKPNNKLHHVNADNRTGMYRVAIPINNKRYNFGTYTNEIAAASIANWFVRTMHLDYMKLNNIEEMSIYEALKYRTHKKPYCNMCSIIDNSLPYVKNKTDGKLMASKCTGITFSHNSYAAAISYHSAQYRIGTFDDIYAAISVRNAYYKYIFNEPGLIDTISNMPVDEALTHRTVKRRTMCTIVDKSENNQDTN